MRAGIAGGDLTSPDRVSQRIIIQHKTGQETYGQTISGAIGVNHRRLQLYCWEKLKTISPTDRTAFSTHTRNDNLMGVYLQECLN